MTITPIHEMSDADRLAVFDRFCEKTRTSTIAKLTDAVSGTFGDMPEIALDDIGGYGWQRRWNDGNGGAEVSAKDKIANGRARFANHLKGVITARGAGMSALETELFRMAMAAFKIAHKVAHKVLIDKSAAEVRAVLVGFIGDGMADWERRAQESLDRKAVEAQIRAEEMAALLDKRDSVDFDLAKFGL